MHAQQNPHEYGEVVVANVDIQNDFALRTGALSVENGEAVLQPANAINTYVRGIGGLVAFTQDWHRPDNMKHFGLWGAHCVQNKAGAALHDDLIVLPRDTIAQKGTGLNDDGYSGWEAEVKTGAMAALVENLTAHDRTLGMAIGKIAAYGAERGQKTAVILTGLATDYCVKATGLDGLAATDRDYVDIIVATDAVRPVEIQKGDGRKALDVMTAAGALLMTSNQIVAGGIKRIAW